jgi:hypothetical protein
MIPRPFQSPPSPSFDVFGDRKMSTATKNKVNKFLKTKRIDGELQGKFSFSLRWPLICSHDQEYNFVSGPTFTTCGSSWCVSVHPNGIDETGEYLSLRLVNLSPDEVFASYTLILKNQKGGADKRWKDPEGIVLFSAKEEGDNSWGCDEFISVQEIYTGDEFTANEKIIIEVQIEVYGREHLKTEVLSQAIQDTAEKTEIIKLADEEIYELAKKLPVLRDSVAQKKQEDGILKSRSSGKH